MISGTLSLAALLVAHMQHSQAKRSQYAVFLGESQMKVIKSLKI